MRSRILDPRLQILTEAKGSIVMQMLLRSRTNHVDCLASRLLISFPKYIDDQVNNTITKSKQIPTLTEVLLYNKTRHAQERIYRFGEASEAILEPIFQSLQAHSNTIGNLDLFLRLIFNNGKIK
jgi:hypothetical protein